MGGNLNLVDVASLVKKMVKRRVGSGENHEHN